VGTNNISGMAEATAYHGRSSRCHPSTDGLPSVG